MNELQKRAVAVEAAKARFEGRPFDWRGQGTCIHLLRFHAAQMGHSVPIVPRFKSALGAKKSLLATGWQTLPALLDSMLERIPPAFMRVGDVLAMPGDQDWQSLVIKADRHKFLGWHQASDNCLILEVDVTAAIGAWRV